MAEIMCSNDINWAFRYLSNSKRADGDPDPILHFRPVHWAVVAGNVPALRLLLLHGAKPLGPSATRLTTLHLAALTGNTAVMERLQRLLYQTYYSQDHYVSDEYLKPAAELHEYPLHFAAAYATNPTSGQRLIIPYFGAFLARTHWARHHCIGWLLWATYWQSTS